MMTPAASCGESSLYKQITSLDTDILDHYGRYSLTHPHHYEYDHQPFP